MHHYKNVVLGLSLSRESDELLVKRILEMNLTAGQLHLVHAVEHLASYGAAYGVAAGIDIDEMLLEEAKKMMLEVGKQLSVSPHQQIVKMGSAKVVILEEAESVNADLIVVGSHGRCGVRLLLGSTANAVLHGALCDVLAIRVKD